MVSAVVSRVMILTLGTLYPAYRSYKAVRTKDVREYVKWMMYWIVFALFCFTEAFADVFVAFWFPFYYEVKILFVIWLLSPWTKGASILYRKWIHPTLTRHEQDIDALLDQAKVEGYNTLVKVGSHGVKYAREVVTTAALKGQMQLVNQLQRSASMGDVTDGVVGDDDVDQPRRNRLQIREIEEEEVMYDDQGREVRHTAIIDEQFAYLDDEDRGDPDFDPSNPDPGPLRRSGRRKAHSATALPPGGDAHFATMPRSGARSTRSRARNDGL